MSNDYSCLQPIYVVEKDEITEEEKKCMKTFNFLFQKIRMKKMRKRSENERRKTGRGRVSLAST